MTEITSLADVSVARAEAAAVPTLAGLQALCFPDDPWGSMALARLLALPGSLALVAVAAEEGEPVGFALLRMAAGEAELLSLGVRPQMRRRGVARRLLAATLREARAAGSETLFLEVAVDNGAALALYRATGFGEVGRRQAYYRRAGGRMVDAAVMRRTLSARAESR
jgi:ribosomal-protein-alanine N-acetyltransferase